MADNWNAEFKRHIAPGDPGSYRETTDGKFVFVAPIEGSDVYDIKYTDGDRRGSMQYVVNAGDCVSCDCGKISYKAPSGKISSNGGDNVTLGTNFKITHAYCEKNYTPTFTPGNNVSNVHLDGTTIKGNVPSNNGEEREITFSVNFNGHVCPNTDKYHLMQEHGCTCGNNSFTYTPSVTEVGAGGYSGVIGSFSMHNGCSSSRIGVSSSNMSVSKSGSNITATIPANAGGGKTFTYTVTLDGSDCGHGAYSISQAAGCDCDDLSFTVTQYTAIPFEGGNFTLGKLSTSSECGIGDASATISVGSVSIASNGDVNAYIPENPSDDYVRSITVSFSYKGVPCAGKDASFSQLNEERYCLVDNCSDDDLFINPTAKQHPLVLGIHESEASRGYGTMCDSTHWSHPEQYDLLDITYKDVDIPVGGTYVSTDPSNGWNSSDNWLTVEITDDPEKVDGCHEGACTSQKACYYEYRINSSNTTKTRIAKVHWGWKDDQWSPSNTTCGDHDKPSGMKYKKESYVFLILPPTGKHYDGGEDHEQYDQYGRHYYILRNGYE